MVKLMTWNLERIRLDISALPPPGLPMAERN
jgi:hypothetical protein